MRIGDKNKETVITVLEAFKIAIRKTGQINVRKENEEETIEYIDMAIEALKSQSKIGEWIPCSEQLPEDGVDVLVWFECCRYEYSSLFQTIGISYTYDGKWSGFVNNQSGWNKLRIIAWQPLPEAYRIQDGQSEEQERSEEG